MLLEKLPVSLLRTPAQLFQMDNQLRTGLTNNTKRRGDQASLDSFIRNLHANKSRIFTKLGHLGTQMTSRIRGGGLIQNSSNMSFVERAYTTVVLGPQWLIQTLPYSLSIHEKLDSLTQYYELELRLDTLSNAHILVRSDHTVAVNVAQANGTPKLKIKAGAQSSTS